MDVLYLTQRWTKRVRVMCSTVSMVIRKVKTVKETLRNQGIFC